MSITYESQGAGNGSQTSAVSLSPACPATVDAGRILIAHVIWEGTSEAPDTPTGWTLLHGPVAIETVARHWLFGKIADGTEDGTSIVFALAPLSTNQRGARIYSFAGRVSGSITDCVLGFSTTTHATDPQMPSVTTTKAGSLAVALVAQNDNNALADATGESGGDWVEAVAEYVAALTPGFVLQIQTAAMASVGTISGGAVAATNDPSGVIAFEIRDSIPAQSITGVGAIATAEAFGSGAVTQPGTGINITGVGNIATAEAFGTDAVDFTLKSLGNIATAEAFGSPSLDLILKALGAVASGETFGTVSLDFTLKSLGAVASGETFGSPALDLRLLSLGAIASGESFGTAKLNFKLLGLGAIASAETFGSPSADLRVVLIGIGTAEAFGSPALDFTLKAFGNIASAEAFGTPEIGELVPGQSITGVGNIATGESLGSPALDFTIRGVGAISSSETFGNQEINFTLKSLGNIASGETHGSQSVEFTLRGLGNITSLENFGTPTLDLLLHMTGIASGEAFGDMIVVATVYDPTTGEAFFVEIPKEAFFIDRSGEVAAVVDLPTEIFGIEAGRVVMLFGNEQNGAVEIFDGEGIRVGQAQRL